MNPMKAKVTRDADTWEVVVEAEIPAEDLARYRAEALKEIQRDAKLDGFRPGHAPESEIIRVYGETLILKHAAEHAVEHELPEILARENMPVVEAPRVTIGAPVPGKPLSFTARAALAPEIKLPDYGRIAKKHSAVKEEAEVSDAEHAQAMTHLKRERARIEKVEAGASPAEAAEQSRAMEEKDLPALDDEFARSIGYEGIEQFHTAVRKNMKSEKARIAAEKRRQAMLDELAKEATIRYPAIMREYELDDIEGRLKDDLERSGTTFEAYLTHAKKTRETLREEWKNAADVRAKIRLILSEIARKENIEPDAAALDREMEHARTHYPAADAQVLRSHITHAMRNDAVLKFLENQS